IVTSGGITPTDTPHTYRVASQTRQGHGYRVNGQCTCSDVTKAPGRWCKHKLAVALYIRTEQAYHNTVPETTQLEDVPVQPPTAADPLHPDLEAHLIERYTYETKGVRSIR